MFTYSQLLSKTNPDVTARPLNIPNAAKEDCRGTVRINGVDVAFMQLQNDRSHEEDAFAIAEVKGFDALPFKAQELALKETFRKLDAKHGQEQEIGTTVCAAIISHDHVVVANVGDSAAFQSSKRMNTLHTPKEDAEKKRITEGGGLILRGRIYGDLEVSRALGDQSCRDGGLIATPDVTRCSRSLHGSIIVATDGMTLDENELGEVIQKNAEQPLEIDHQLLSKTKEKESTKSRTVKDNATVLVLPLNPPPPVGSSSLVMVCDGHGGDKVAKAVCENFCSTLEKEIERVSTPEKFAETKAQVERELFEEDQPQRNRDAIKAQFEAYAKKMDTPKLPVFIEVTTEGGYKKIFYQMAFAINERKQLDILNQLEKLADENRIPHGNVARGDNHLYTFPIQCKQDVAILPTNFITFLEAANKIINPRSDAALLSTFGLLRESEGKKVESAAPAAGLKLTG
jgi:serine/threonine protein phosphatase PrpC